MFSYCAILILSRVVYFSVLSADYMKRFGEDKFCLLTHNNKNVYPELIYNSGYRKDRF